jgi:hypothetical protein
MVASIHRGPLAEHSLGENGKHGLVPNKSFYVFAPLLHVQFTEVIESMKPLLRPHVQSTVPDFGNPPVMICIVKPLLHESSEFPLLLLCFVLQQRNLFLHLFGGKSRRSYDLLRRRGARHRRLHAKTYTLRRRWSQGIHITLLLEPSTKGAGRIDQTLLHDGETEAEVL